MKKRLICVLCLIAVLTLTFAGCGANKIVGKWTWEADFGEYMNDMMAESGMGDYFDFDKVAMYMIFEFDKDGTVTMTIDEEATEESFAEMGDILYDGMCDYMIDLAGVSEDEVDDYMAENGLSKDDILETMGLDALIDELEGLETEGEYEYKDGELTIDDEEVECELDGDKLTLELTPELMGWDEEEFGAEMAEYLLPAVLTRN